MKVFILVRNKHDEREDTDFTTSIYDTFEKAYDAMKKEYNDTLSYESVGNTLYSYNLYSNSAFIGYRYYNVVWEIHEKEINF